MIPWGAIRSLPEYKQANPLLQRTIRAAYFDDYGDQYVEDPNEMERNKRAFIAGDLPSLEQGQGKEQGILGRVLQVLGIDLPTETSPRDKARATVELMAKEEGVPLSEYRQASEIPEQFAGRAVDMLGLGLPGALSQATRNEAFVPEATTTGGKIAGGLGDLFGLIQGAPINIGRGVAGKLMGPAATTNAKLISLVKNAFTSSAGRKVLLDATAREAITLGVASGMHSAGQALQEKSALGAAKVLGRGLAEGTATGAVFGASRGIQNRIARIATGLAALEATRSTGLKPPILDDRPISEKAFDLGLSVAFLWGRGGPKVLSEAEADLKAAKEGKADPHLIAETIRAKAKPLIAMEGAAPGRGPEPPAGGPESGGLIGPPTPPPAPTPSAPPTDIRYQYIPPGPMKVVRPQGLPEQLSIVDNARTELQNRLAPPLTSDTGQTALGLPGPELNRSASARGMRGATSENSRKSGFDSLGVGAGGRDRHPLLPAPRQGGSWRDAVRARAEISVEHPGQPPITIRPGDSAIMIEGDERIPVTVKTVNAEQGTINGRPAKLFYRTPKQLPAPKGAIGSGVKKRAVAGKIKNTVRGNKGHVYAGGKKSPVRYEVVEASDLIPSHKPDTFAKNPRYPEGIQERSYHRDKAEQIKVIDHAKNLKTIYLLTNNPDAVNGPPITLPSGVVLGGNSRAMSIQRAYSAGPKGKKYKDKLIKFSGQFGLDPDKVAAMREPVLVRKLRKVDDLSTQNLHRLATRYNATPTQAMDEASQTASHGANVSPKTLERVGDTLTAADKTLREYLARPDGIKILDRLIQDGVIPETDRPKYINTRYRQLNNAGKEVIEKTILGAIIKDADVLDAAPKSYVNKIARALTPLSKLKAREGEKWDITGDIQKALELAMAAKEANLTVQEFIKQRNLFGEEAGAWTDRQATLANALESLSSVKLAGKIKELAAIAASDTKNQTFMFGRPDPEQEFARIFAEQVIAGSEGPSQEKVSEGQKVYGFKGKGEAATVYILNAAKAYNGPPGADGRLSTDGSLIISGKRVYPGDKLYMVKDRAGKPRYVEKLSDADIAKIRDLYYFKQKVKRWIDVSSRINRKVAKGGPGKQTTGLPEENQFMAAFMPPAWETERYKGIRNVALARRIDDKFRKHDPEAIEKYLLKEEIDRHHTLFVGGGYLHVDEGTPRTPDVVAALKAYSSMGGQLGATAIRLLYPGKKGDRMVRTIIEEPKPPFGGKGAGQKDMFGDFGKPRDMFGQVEPDKKAKRRRGPRKTKPDNPREAQIDLFSGKADKPMQPSLFARSDEIRPKKKDAGPQAETDKKIKLPWDNAGPEDEDKWYGTEVKISPETIEVKAALKKGEPAPGPRTMFVARVLNNGKLLELYTKDDPTTTVRIRSDRVVSVGGSGVTASPDDIDYDLAMSAHRNTSYVPETRAKQEQVSAETLGSLKKSVISTIATLKLIENGEKGMSPSLFKSSLANKIKRAIDNGEADEARKALEFLKEQQAKHLKKPVFTERHGIWNYTTKEKPAAPAQDAFVATFDGGRVVNDIEAERVRILFDSKPSAEMRRELKKNGFRWAPSEGAWQRKNTNAGISAAERITGAKRVANERPEPPSPPKQMTLFEPVEKYGTAAKVVNVKDLVPMEDVGGDSAKLQRARGYFRDVAAGKRAPRAPLTGVLRDDGKIAIVDGNTTLTVLRENGVKEVPVIVNRVATQPSDVAKDVDAVFDHAREVMAEFRKEVLSAAKTLGGKAVFRPGLKSKDRATEKINDYGGDAKRLTDVLAATIELPDEGSIKSAVREIDDILHVVAIKDRYARPTVAGYRDVSLKIVLSNGHVAELQLNTPAMIAAKESLGHKIYEAVRGGDVGGEKLQDLVDISRKYYDEVSRVDGEDWPDKLNALDSEMGEAFQRVLSERSTGISLPPFNKKASPSSADRPTTLKTPESDSRKNSFIEKPPFGQNIGTPDEKVNEPPAYYKPPVKSSAQLDLFAFKPKKLTPQWLTSKGFVSTTATGKLPAGSKKVKDVDDAASLLAPMGNYAQEVLMMVFTDKDGNVLEVLRHSMGLISSSQVGLYIITGRAFNVPGTKKAYFVHNHPSGSLTPSSVSSREKRLGGALDRETALMLRRLMELKGIEMKSLIIGDGEYSTYDEDFPIHKLSIIKSNPLTEIPIKERIIGKNRPKGSPQISNYVEVYEFLKKHGLLKKEGFLLTDAKLKVVGVLEYDAKKGTLPAVLAADLIAAAERHNSQFVIPFFKKSIADMKRVEVYGALDRISKILHASLTMSPEIVFTDPDPNKTSISVGVNKDPGISARERNIKSLASDKTVLYSGLAAIPARVMGGAASGALAGIYYGGPIGAAVGAGVGAGLEFVGTPLWDKWVTKRIPGTLERVPVVGRATKIARRALDTGYRGDLPGTKKYLRGWKKLRLKTQRGSDYGINLGQRLNELDEDAQLRVGSVITGEADISTLSKKEQALAGEAMAAMVTLGKQAVDVGLLNEETFFRNAGRYMPRLYTSKEYQGLLSKYKMSKPTRMDLSRFKRRKDIPREIREAMGEILTPGYPIAKGIVQLTRDIEMARWFRRISENRDWAYQPRPEADVLDRVRDMIDEIRRQHPNIDLQDIADVLDDQIPDLDIKIKRGKSGRRRIDITTAGEPPSNFKKLPVTPKLGRLSGAYVHPEIWNDLNDVVRPIAEWQPLWNKALGMWKFGKVILSPKTHIRNMISNSLLAHIGGLPLYKQPYYLKASAHELRFKTSMFEEAKREGLLSSTFTEAELRELYDSVEQNLTGIKANSAADALGPIGKAVDVLRKAGKKAARIYELEEQWFKLAMYLHAREKLAMTPEAAAELATKWLFDYQDITRFQRKYRQNPLGAPFATFTFKAIPRILEASIKTPHRMLLPMAIITSLGIAAQAYFDDDQEQERAKRKLRPEWMRGSYLGVPNFQRVPITDESGREYWLNLTYITPWGDIGESGGAFGIPGGLMPLSQPFVKEFIEQASNYSWFWKDKIVKDKVAAQGLVASIKARMAHLAATMAPTPLIDAEKIYSAYKNIPDYRGRYRPRSVVLADVIAGFKMYPVDYTEQFQREINKLHPGYGKIARDLKSELRSLFIKKAAMDEKGGDSSVLDDRIDEILNQFAGLSLEISKIAETYSRAMGAGEARKPITKSGGSPNWRQRLRERMN